MNCTSFEQWLIERGEGQPAGEAPARLELPPAAVSHLAGCTACRHIWEEELLLDQVIPVWRERVPVTTEFASRVIGTSSEDRAFQVQQGRLNHHDSLATSQPAISHSASNHSASNHSASNHSASNHSASNHSASNHSGNNHSANGQSTHHAQRLVHSQVAHSRTAHSRTAILGRFAAVGLATLVLVTFGRSAWLGQSTNTTVVSVPTRTAPSGLEPSRAERSTSTQSSPGKSATSVARGAVSSGAVDIPFSLAWAASDVHETYRQIAQETSAVLDDIVEPPDLQTMASNWPVWSVAQQADRSEIPAAAPNLPGIAPQIDLSQSSTSVRTRSLATGWAKAFDFVFEALPETPPLEES